MIGEVEGEAGDKGTRADENWDGTLKAVALDDGEWEGESGGTESDSLAEDESDAERWRGLLLPEFMGIGSEWEVGSGQFLEAMWGGK